MHGALFLGRKGRLNERIYNQDQGTAVSPMTPEGVSFAFGRSRMGAPDHRIGFLGV